MYCSPVGVGIAFADNFFGQYCHPTPAGLVLGAGGWWGDAEIFETILDAFETTGNKKYQTYFAQLAADFFSCNGIRWDYNLYNDDIQFMQLAPVSSDGATPNTTPADSGYICFRNVDFGSKGATRASLRLYSARQGGSYTLYVDKISSETKIGTVNGLETGWNTYRIKTAKTAGMHTLYAVPSGSGGSMFHWVVFAGPKSF